MRSGGMFGTDLSHPPLPKQGMLLSVGAHALFLIATLMVPWNYWIPPGPRLITQAEQIRQEALTLPNLLPQGGGRPSAAAPGGGLGQPRQKPQPAPANRAKATRGVAYKGRQLVVSNPARPDNFIQTIRQPALRKPPRIPAPLPVPSMVSKAAAMPAVNIPTPQAPQKASPPPVAVLPLSVPMELSKVDAPKLALPAAPQQLPQTPVVEPIRALPSSVSHKLAKLEPPRLPASSAPQQSPLQAVTAGGTATTMPKFAPAQVGLEVPGNSTRNILVLNAVSNPNAKPGEIPPGELHGSFTVSPIGESETGLAGGGYVAEGSPGSVSGTRGGEYAGVGGATEGGSAAGAGIGNGIATGVVSGAGSGSDIGSGNGGTGSGTGSGTGKGTAAGVGSGSGRGSGGGSGGGTGGGTSPFPEVMIQGGSQLGSGRGGGQTTVGITFGAQVRPTYGITIVANGASGGGFPDYGIFRDDTSYTVYLDMSDEGLHGESWPLQYALQGRPADSGDAKRQGVLVSPFPVSKVLPKFSREAASRNRGRRIVVLGVIGQGGGWQTLRVMQSPDAELTPAVLDALRQWIFKPAEMNGSPVAVKCLIGVFVNTPR